MSDSNPIELNERFPVNFESCLLRLLAHTFMNSQVLQILFSKQQ